MPGTGDDNMCIQESILETDDETAGDGFGVAAIGGVVDAVAEVDYAPVDVGEDGGVEAEDVTVGEVIGVLGRLRVAGDAEEDFAVGLDGKDREFDGEARASEAAVNLAGDVASAVCGDVDGAEFEDLDVEAKGPGEFPGIVGKAALFRACCAVDGEPGLGSEVGGDDGEKDEGKELKKSLRHGSASKFYGSRTVKLLRGGFR